MYANAFNVLIRTAEYKFLENTGIIDFDALSDRNPTADRQDFVDHPMTIETGNTDYPQLWKPFSSAVKLVQNDRSVIAGVVRMDEVVSALHSYKRRFDGVAFGPITLPLESIVPTARMWSDSHIFLSVLFKKQFAGSSNNVRGGEYVMFTSNHIQGSSHSGVVTSWYVAKVLFFFEYNIESTRSSVGSFFAVAEVMNKHSTASHSKSIPRVLPFSGSGSQKKVVVFDVADIVTTVGLVQESSASKWLYVISPSTAFNNDMNRNAGMIRNLL